MPRTRLLKVNGPRMKSLHVRKHRTLVFSCLEYLTFYLCRYNLPPILPFLISHFDLTHGKMGALASAGFASYAVVLLPAGFFGDALGPKRVVTLGATISIISNIVFPYVPDFQAALAIQFLNGLGQGMAWGPLTRLVSDKYSKESMGLVMSILLVPPNVGPSLAYVTSTYLATSYDWRAAFSFPSLVLLTSTVLFWSLIKNQPPEFSGRKDEYVTIKEKLRLVVLDRSIWFIALAYTCYMCIYRSLLVWLPTYLAEEAHLSAFSASILGGLVTLSGVGSMFAGTFLARSESRGRSRLVIASSFALAGPLIWMMPHVEDPTQVLPLFSMVFAFLNLGGSLYFAYSPVFLSEDVVGTASGFVDSLAYVGSFLGVLGMGLVYDAYASYDPVFIILTGIAAFGLMVSLLIRK